MNQTIEKTTDENTNMMNNQFFGEVSEQTMSKEDMFRGLLKNKYIVLDEQFTEAARVHTRCCNNEKYSNATFEAQNKCKLIEAQMKVVSELLQDFEDMLTPDTSMAMAV